jgi:hypothetical protein
MIGSVAKIKQLQFLNFIFTMQTINPDSENILILALTGTVLSGTWLAYKLKLFKAFSTINDEKRILLPSFLFLFSPFLFPFIFSHYMLPESPGIYIVLSAVVSGIMLLTSNFINNKFQLEREAQQRIWQEKSEQQKWYREKNYDCYRTSIQLSTKILQEYLDIKVNEKVKNIVTEDKRMNFNKLILEFSSEFAIIIAGHPNKNSKEFKEKIDKINTSLDKEPWIVRNIITDIMEQDSRIKNINE